MNVVSNLTNNDIKELVHQGRMQEKEKVEPKKVDPEPEHNGPEINLAGLDDLDDTPKMASPSGKSKCRNILVVGTGDGGCNIAAEVKKRIPDHVSCVLYNTSARAMERHRDVADAMIIPKTEDGSGKDRSYSKDVFRKGSFKALLKAVTDITEAKEIDYIIITTTADGGTGGGASPNIAKFLSGNTTVPVIILGVLPTLSEDAKAQYNALAWQSDVEKTGLPHIVFDNNSYDGNSKVVIHSAINHEIAKCMEVITGVAYGDTNISSIDNRDMLMILVNAGKRIVIDTTNAHPNVSDTFDDFILELLDGGYQPMPKHATAIGIFVKGPKQFIESMDTSLIGVRKKIGNGQLYTHIEESDRTRISIIAAGCTSYDDRMYLMKQRYEDIMSAASTDTTSAADLMTGMKNPFETKIEKKVVTDEVDTSGLDL